MEVTALLQQLEELETSAARSLAAEVESAVEGGACLVDDVGRARILAICEQVRSSCQRLSSTDAKAKSKLSYKLQRSAPPLGVKPRLFQTLALLGRLQPSVLRAQIS